MWKKKWFQWKNEYESHFAQVRAGKSMLPYLTLGFLVMMACAVVSVLIRAHYLQQHSPPKVQYAVVFIQTFPTDFPGYCRLFLALHVLRNCTRIHVHFWHALCLNPLRHPIPGAFHWG